MGSKIADCLFVDYANHSATYRLLVLKSDVLEPNTIIETKNVEFFDNIFPLKTKVDKPLSPNLEELNNEVNQDNEIEPRRSTRVRKEKNFGDEFFTFLMENDPNSYKEAFSSPDAPFWRETINSEIESIMSNHTWELVELPPRTKTIGCK